MSELAHLHRGAGRQRAEVLHAHVDVLEELIDVGDVGVGLHDIGERGPRRGQRGLDVLADLAELRPHVARSDDLAARSSGELARDEDRLLALHDDHVRVEHVTAHHPLAERFRLDVLSFHDALSGRGDWGWPPRGGRSVWRLPYSARPGTSTSGMLRR